ncbi:chlorophyll A-B binding protein [Aureococcus anophagefferens]|nr:chlorophyll A-B binding protein [Aureococcus anophagefferens]
MLKSIALTSLFATGGAFVAPAATTSSSALRADVFGIEQEEALLNAKREGQDSWGAAVDVKENDVFGFSLPVSYSTQELRAASVALPFAERPAVLDELALPGDFGFDPLGLAGDSAESLLTMRDAEIRHARLAMLAAVGWPLSELVHPTLASSLNEPSLVFKLGGDDVPSVLNGGLGDVPVVFWISAVAVAVAAELAGIQAKESGKMSGDLGFRFGADAAANVLGSPAKVAEAEIVNGRVAMLAVTAYVVQEFAARLSGIPVPVVSSSYGLFHPFF